MMIGKNKCIALLPQAKSQRKCILLFTEVFNNLMVVTTTRFAHLCPQHDHKIFIRRSFTQWLTYVTHLQISVLSLQEDTLLLTPPQRIPQKSDSEAVLKEGHARVRLHHASERVYVAQATPVEVQNYSICLFNFRVTQNQQSFMLPLFDIFWLLQILCCAYHKNSAPVLGFIKTVYLQVGIRTLF